MNNKYVLILLVSSTLFLVSCKHTMNAQDSSRKKGDFANLMDAYYNAFSDSYSDAALLLVRHSDFNSANALAEHYSVGFINESMIIPNSIYINNQVLNSQNEYTVHNESEDGLTTTIYGNNLMIKFDNEVLTDSFYNATAISVSCNINENYFIENGMTFTWNSDPNSQGVIFHVKAYVGGNSEATETQEKEMMLDDNGSFTIPSGWLDEFPDGISLAVSFKRGNYAMLNAANNKKVSIIAMSSSSQWFIKK